MYRLGSEGRSADQLIRELEAAAGSCCELQAANGNGDVTAGDDEVHDRTSASPWVP